MIRLLAVFILATIALGAAPAAVGATDPAVCLKTCIDQYGSDKKQSCALQCGYGQNTGNSGAAKDCGTIYKQCLAACASDKACKDGCRKARTSCI